MHDALNMLDTVLDMGNAASIAIPRQSMQTDAKFVCGDDDDYIFTKVGGCVAPKIDKKEESYKKRTNNRSNQPPGNHRIWIVI